jgi:aerobic-type carbon monoxide dehydrogenase small subunit (CoxS/CutS family)
MLEFTVNGNPVSIEEQPGEMLSDLLRLRLRLTGTKIACQEDECGACTVLLDGQPVLSCSFPAAKAHHITNLTGLHLPLKWKHKKIFTLSRMPSSSLGRCSVDSASRGRS